MNDNYQNAIKLITQQGRFRIDLSLKRTKKILELLGNPQNKFNIIHVAGTNGKGSVCAVLAKILETSGLKTGLYTSPHLTEYTERIKINSCDISENDFSSYITNIVQLANANNLDLTEFEILTALAFQYFADLHVEYAIIETGLGGRFDATNAAENKLLTIITSVSFDHMDKLGDTIEKIAFEKAGIIRKTTPVIISEKNKGFETIAKYTKNEGGLLVTPKDEVFVEFKENKNRLKYQGKSYFCPLLGLYQAENFKLIFKAVELLREKNITITENALRQALKEVSWNSRFQYIKEKNLLIDGAHNEDSAKVLRESLDYYFPHSKRLWIFGAMNTKDYKTVSQNLFEPEDKVYFYHFEDKRSISYDEFKKVCPIARKEIDENQLQNILEQNSKDTLKIATGSFYVTGKVLEILSCLPKN